MPRNRSGIHQELVLDGNVIRVVVGPQVIGRPGDNPRNERKSGLLKEIEIVWDDETSRRIPHG